MALRVGTQTVRGLLCSLQSGVVLLAGLSAGERRALELAVVDNPCGLSRPIVVNNRHRSDGVNGFGHRLSLWFVDELASVDEAAVVFRPHLVVSGRQRSSVGHLEWLHPDLTTDWMDRLCRLDVGQVLVTSTGSEFTSPISYRG